MRPGLPVLALLEPLRWRDEGHPGSAAGSPPAAAARDLVVGILVQ